MKQTKLTDLIAESARLLRFITCSCFQFCFEHDGDDDVNDTRVMIYKGRTGDGDRME